MSTADQILTAQLTGAARHHARWRPLPAGEHDAAVAALRELAAGRADLLAQVAGLLEGSAEGHPDEPLKRQAAQLAAVLPGYERSKDALPMEVLFTRQQAAAVRDGTADAGLICSSEDLTGLRTAELITEAPVALLPAGHPLASRLAVSIGELRRLDTFAEKCPDSSLDQIIDLVALRRLTVVVSDSITGKLGPEVTTVPVTGVPDSLLVLGWMPAIPPPALAAFISQAKRVTDSLVPHLKAS